MIKRAPRQPRHRTRLPNGFQPTVPSLNWTAAIIGGEVRITTTQAFSIGGLPVGITVQGVPPIAINPQSSTSFDLVYNTPVVATNVLSIPAGVPQVRNAVGGTLAAGVFTFP